MTTETAIATLRLVTAKVRSGETIFQNDADLLELVADWLAFRDKR